MIKEKNGFKYSTEEFEGYKFRVKFIAENKEGYQQVNTDVYTDNTNREEVTEILCNSAKKKNLITSRHWTGVVGWTTKEQDDLTAKFIEETLKDI